MREILGVLDGALCSGFCSPRGGDGYQRGRVSIKNWCSHLEERGEERRGEERRGEERRGEELFPSFSRVEEKNSFICIKRNVSVPYIKLKKEDDRGWEGGKQCCCNLLASVIQTFPILELRESQRDGDRGRLPRMTDRQIWKSEN